MNFDDAVLGVFVHPRYVVCIVLLLTQAYRAIIRAVIVESEIAAQVALRISEIYFFLYIPRENAVITNSY